MIFLRKPIIFSLLAFSALYGTVQAQAAESIHHEMKLILSMAGIPVGKLAFDIKIGDGKYNISGFAKTYGASKLFSKAKGSANSGGRYENYRLTNISHSLNYTTKKKKGNVVLKFGENGLEFAKVTPIKAIKPGTVIVKPSHLKSVQDPVSTTLIAVDPGMVGNGAAICNRTLAVYDGKNRFDLKMRYKGKRKVVTRGFKGTSYVCGVRYLPVAGHRPHKKEIKRLTANKNMEISLARIGNSSLYGLIQFKVKTKYGTIVGKPSYYVSTIK